VLEERVHQVGEGLSNYAQVVVSQPGPFSFAHRPASVRYTLEVSPARFFFILAESPKRRMTQMDYLVLFFTKGY
jgi:hypothetical protein